MSLFKSCSSRVKKCVVAKTRGGRTNLSVLSAFETGFLDPFREPESWETGRHDVKAGVIRRAGSEEREQLFHFEKVPRPW